MFRLLKFYRLLPSVEFPLLQHATIRPSMFTSKYDAYLRRNLYQTYQNSQLMMSVSTEKLISDEDNSLQLQDEITRKQEELAKKAEEYTTTVGSYTAWNTNVDLGPPDSTVSLTKDDVHIQDYYNALQYSLFENNLPETIDRTQKPRTCHPDTEVAIVVLASPVECLAILLEGGRQCPGEMLLVMSPTWLIKDKSNKGEGQHSLFVKKAIVFDRTGTSFIDVFEKPRRCTYFVNFFTRACTDGQRNDGVDIELDLDCPMSSSIELCKYVDDKLLTRIWMAEAGVHYPETLAVVYKPAYEYNVPNDANIEVIVVERKKDVNNNIVDKVKHFLKLENIQSIGKIVVKPSGIMWHGSRCVSFHEVANVEEICKAVTDLLSILEVENAVMIEAFYHPVESTNPKLADYSFRLRTNVCRRIDDTPIATQMVCGIGLKNQPINGDNTIPHSFETTMQMWNMDKTEIKRLLNTVSQGSEKIMDSIIAFERTLSTDLRGGVGAQTDLIGIDYVLGMVNGQMEPVGIEVNSHDCTINCQLFEFLNPHRQGEAVKPLVETMIRRSQLFAMQDKTVLVIGAGGFSKMFIWDSYKSFGINVVLVDPDDSTCAASKASHFIQYNFLDHKHDEDHATYIIKLLKERGLAVDGCVTFWEDCGPLAATVCETLKLNGPGKQAAQIAKMKSWTQNVLRTKTGDIPHFPRTYLYTSKCHPVKSESDIDKAIDHVGIPAVLKLEYGSSAVGVKPVRDRIECTNTYQQIKNHLRSEADHPGIGLGYGNDVMLMENIDGTEHDVDVVIFQRQLITAFVSDNGPARNGSYTETTALMPTCLPLDRKGQLIIAAYQCCTEIGLVDGVFNVEMKMTNTGPKLIEINARMGGFYLRDWIKTCYGHDILLYAFMISLGIRPVINKHEPRCTILGTMCVPSAHKQQLKNPNNLNLLNTLIQKKAVRYNQIEASLEDCGSADEEEPFCNIAVVDVNLNIKRSKRKLTNICNALGLNTKTYDLNYLLEDFKES
ncbi:carnosine synthase 1-like [Mytilus galloprovincialis]|uniref:carnosine synthase 1-like n=1 Tax=Mytilus galloprovincialis TaxID=29158 RepID=UPI003F7C2BB8